MVSQKLPIAFRLELSSCLHYGFMRLCFELRKEKIIVLSLKIKEYSHIKAL